MVSKVMLMEKNQSKINILRAPIMIAFFFVSEEWLEVHIPVDRNNQGEASRVRACEVSVWLSPL